MDIMDKADKLLEALEKSNIQLSEGQTAIVCNDGVAVITTDREGFDLMLCNTKIDFDYDLGITADDVKQFQTVAGIATELGLQED